MIRPLTCLCVVAAAVAGLYLYSTKHRTLLRDQQISGVLQQAEDARARTVVLRAEYALLNQPDRLAALSGRYLDLRPLVPTQFVQLVSLERHLPPVVAFGAPGDVAAAPVQAPSPAAATDADAPAVAGTPAIDAAPPVAAAPVATLQPLAAKPVRHAAAPAATGKVHAPAAAATTRPAMAVASLRPAGRPPVTVAAYRPVVAPMRRYGSGDIGGSMLGGATEAMAPPVPVAN